MHPLRCSHIWHIDNTKRCSTDCDNIHNSWCSDWYCQCVREQALFELEVARLGAPARPIIIIPYWVISNHLSYYHLIRRHKKSHKSKRLVALSPVAPILTPISPQGTVSFSPPFPPFNQTPSFAWTCPCA